MKFFRFFMPVLVAFVLFFLFRFRESILKVPRIRVGPLESHEPAEDRIRFFFLGDTGTGNESQMQVARSMEERCKNAKPQGVLYLGDNFYQAGVSSVEDPQWQSKWAEPYGSPCLGDVPFYPILGNHDYKGNPSAQIEYSLINPRWRFPNRFYSVQFGSLLRLVAFDTQWAEFCFRPEFCSGDFLLDQLAKDDTTWNVVMGHHPMASASAKADGGGHRGGIRGWIYLPWLCESADLYLSGHAHHFEHRRKKECRTDLVIAGGGGADLYPVTDDTESVFAKSLWGFGELELSKTEMIFRFFDASGSMVYETQKQR